MTGQAQTASIERAPNTQASLTAAAIATQVNAVSTEDTLKYLPSLVIRKRHIGDNFAPIATRTSGLGSSARSLIYADGALLSALIGNNNGNGSPRWTLVTPAEIARVDVLYGPFSAAYSGNAIGTVVNITTRTPDRLEAQISATTHVQQYAYYGTHQTLPTWQVAASVGDRFGPLALMAAFTRTNARSQPVSYVTATSLPAGTTGGYGDVNKTGAAIRVLGAGGIEHHVQDTYKLKAVLDIAPGVMARYVLGIWRDDTRGDVQSYLTGTASGATTYATAASGATTGFNSAVYTRDALHVSHVAELAGHGGALDWQVIATRYRYAHDRQNNPSPDTASGTTLATGFVATRNDLPAALNGGAGIIARQDGTGWDTLDGRVLARAGGMGTISIGAHADHEILNAQTQSIANWLDSGSATGQTRSASHGQTRTLALWAQDELALAPHLTLTLGGRQEWWRAWDGYNVTLSSTANTRLVQPTRSFAGFSPKASLTWGFAPDWSARVSAGQAFRMPTVGELYQTVANGVLLTNPNPNLLPERARSVELAVEYRARRGSLRVSLLNELIQNALISQLNAATATTYVQNVDLTRGRVVEIAGERRGILGRVDIQGSITLADVITARDTVFPAAVGKQLPGVPRMKASAVVTYHPTRQISLSAALRYASRHFANLDNSDTVGNTYQGFDRYVVVDLRAQFRVSDHFEWSVGVDNVNNDRYFLFHPFPQRSFFASVGWKL
ncbi:TonB-dependent receptor [Novosphingobium sp. FSY-8]|uniref:TonB-dependent receptor n=1 Tax=Novosphingobium ovatum TaxID=1908523 RepID=A0ABW9XDN0_9SPHN|nr:TonB-dependent receptor [Novosphingobium ovatum]